MGVRGAVAVSDEGRDLANIIRRLVEKGVLASRTTARPGRHASGAERSIQVVKTQLRTIRTVLFQRGLQLSSESLRYAVCRHEQLLCPQ